MKVDFDLNYDENSQGMTPSISNTLLLYTTLRQRQISIFFFTLFYLMSNVSIYSHIFHILFLLEGFVSLYLGMYGAQSPVVAQNTFGY